MMGNGLRKRRLLVLLGAGASMELEIPGVGAIDVEMASWATAWSASARLPVVWPDVYGHVWSSLERYYDRTTKVALRPKPNFEKALADMLSLEAWLREAPFGTTWSEALGVYGCRDGLPRGTTDATVRHQATTLLAMLAKHMRTAANAVDPKSLKVRQHDAFLQALEPEFDLGIFSLNYDNLATRALPRLRRGFDHAGRFDPASVHGSSAWNFLYHLHGSVHYSLKPATGIPKEIRWIDSLANANDFFDGDVGLSGNDGEGGVHLPRTTLIAGGHKLSQLMYEPHKSYYAALIRAIYEAEALLIIGYGFGDEHVNRALEARCASTGGDLPTVVLDHRAANADCIEHDRSSPWTYAMARSLHARSEFNGEGRRSPLAIDELRGPGLFEVDERERIWVWHHGFLDASRRLDTIIDVLHR